MDYKKEAEINKEEKKSVSDLFKKHFPSVYGGSGVGIFHPNIESFFEELNKICIDEDNQLKQM